MTTQGKPAPKSPPRTQPFTGLTVYPVYRADGRVVWVTVPTTR